MSDSRRADAAARWWLEWFLRVRVESIPRDDKVVVVAHPADGLDDLGFVILDDFDSLEALEGMSVHHHLGPSRTVHTIPSEKHHLAM